MTLQLLILSQLIRSTSHKLCGKGEFHNMDGNKKCGYLSIHIKCTVIKESLFVADENVK